MSKQHLSSAAASALTAFGNGLCCGSVSKVSLLCPKFFMVMVSITAIETLTKSLPCLHLSILSNPHTETVLPQKNIRLPLQPPTPIRIAQ